MSLCTSQPSCCMDHVPAGAETSDCPLFGPQGTQAATRQCLLLAGSRKCVRLSHHHDLLYLLEETPADGAKAVPQFGSWAPFQEAGLSCRTEEDLMFSITQPHRYICALCTCQGSILLSGLHHRGAVPQTLPKGPFSGTGTCPVVSSMKAK